MTTRADPRGEPKPAVRPEAAEPSYAGFVGNRRIATGDPIRVALQLKALVDGGETGTVTLIDDATGDSVSLNLHGTPEQVRSRLERRLSRQPSATEAAESEPPRRAGPGRPKLGVISREVSLLPRHWDWLSEQPGGASAALRSLVDQARRDNEAKDRARRARDAAYQFMHVMAGDLPGFEEATRALYAGDLARLEQLIRPWPKGLREHAAHLVETWQQRAREAEAAEASRG